MKNSTLLLLLVGMTSIAQIKGNKKIETRSFPAENLTDIEISLYANLTIDQSAKEGIRITTDANLFDLIDLEVVDGTLKLNQKEWIRASQRMVITIGAPKLKRVQQGTNDTVKIINLNNESLSVMALNGKIVIEGTTNFLGLGAENGTVDASKAVAKEAYLNIWGHGKAIVNATELLDGKVSNDALLELVSNPMKLKGNISKALANTEKIKNATTRYIDFKIKNNSINRNNFFVVGPKPDGHKFSYGFPMMPGKIRKEKWTTGTKIYRVNTLGLRKLLITITEKDENKTVALF